MEALVNIRSVQLAGTPQPGVDARELHRALQVGRDFTNWIKGRIEEGQFEECQDFSPVLAKSRGGRPSTEYLLSLDMAKHLAMMERNAVGKAVRAWFIEAERRLREGEASAAAEPAADDAAIDVEALAPKLSFVREHRILFGRLAGQRMWIRLGLPMADAETPASSPAVAEAPEVDDWLAERVEAAPGAVVQSSVLHFDYQHWCRNRGWPPRSMKAFAGALTLRGIASLKSNTVQRLGVRLRAA